MGDQNKPGKNDRLTRKDNSKNDVFDILRDTKTGRVLLGNFSCHVSAKVEFLPYPEEITLKLKAICNDGQPVGACFVNDGDTGTVYFDPTLERGLLAIYFAHELTHALDKNLWSASAKTHIYQSETLAFKNQNEFQKELNQLYPEFSNYLLETYPNAKTLHQEMTEIDIGELYGYSKAA